jgi:hypothetical protein
MKSQVFKTDDDIIIDVDKLANLIGDNQKYKYFGLVAKSTDMTQPITLINVNHQK